MVSPLRSTIELEEHNNRSETDQIDKSSDSDSPGDEDFDHDSGVYQVRRSKQESRTKSVVYTFWGDSPDSQTPALNSSHDFCVVVPGSQCGVAVDVESEGVHNEQVFVVFANAAEESETRIDTLDLTSTGAPLPGKKILAYIEDDVCTDALSNEGLSDKTKVETTNASSERVDKGTP